MSLFITPDQLAEVTDRVQHAAQIRWLQAHNWKFEISATGRPRVLVAEMERHMLGGGQKRPRRLNLEAIAVNA
ncbi:MAG: DUF4224 domain-containing protein [Burkholderiales bacterium]